MNYKINGTVFQNLNIWLDKNEYVIAEPGRLIWMSDSVSMNTSIHGGVLNGIKRTITGEKFLLVKFTAKKDDCVITLAGNMPGKIIDFDHTNIGPMICERDAFIASEGTVNVSPHIIRSVGFGILSGKKFLFQELRGDGISFIGSAGEHSRIMLKEGEIVYANLSSIIAFNKGIGISITLIPGIRNLMFAESGMFLAKLKGPGSVIVQNTLQKPFNKVGRKTKV